MATHQTTSATPGPASTPFESLTSWLESRMSDLDIPGTALGVFHHDEMHSAGLGVTDTHSNTPVTPSTAFRIASLTKIFTASGIAALSNDTTLSLSSPVESWYPDFQLADPALTASVTIPHLLSHSGGWADPAWPEPGPETDNLGYHAGRIATALQLLPPGRELNYSNSSYLLAGHIIASITGDSYEQSIFNLILDPLGMANTGFVREDVEHLDVASGHVATDAGNTPIDLWDIPRAVHPAGALLSTVDDLLRFTRFHAGLLAPDPSPLTAAQRLFMQLPHGPGGSLGPIRATSIGLGWMRSSIGGRQVVMSLGSDSGLAAAMAIAPDDEFGVVALANADPGLVVVTEAISQAFDGFLHARQPPLAPVALAPDTQAAAAGTYAIPGDFAFEVTATEGGLEIAASAGDQLVPSMSGPLRMHSATTGFVEMGGSPFWYDFVPGDDGMVQWLRFYARIARRT